MASGNMKEIKNRIKSVGNTMQITKAMELVASSKLRKAKENSEKSNPYFKEIYNTMLDIISENTDFTSIYLKKREIKNTLYIVIAGERGLAGGYNNNIFKAVTNDSKDKNSKFITLGKKANDFFSKNNDIISSFDDFADDISIKSSENIAFLITELYKKNKVDEVYVCYTGLVSPLVQTPNILKILPLNFEELSKKTMTLIEYDGGAESVFDKIAPQYISGVLYGAITSSFASEQAARRIAMESASDNASEMIDSLSLIYNRARQDAITQELTEIVAGSKS